MTSVNSKNLGSTYGYAKKHEESEKNHPLVWKWPEMAVFGIFCKYGWFLKIVKKAQ